MAHAVDVIDSRRLTGPNLHTRSPGVVVELRVGAELDLDGLIASWRAAVGVGLDALGWIAQLHVRRHVDPQGGRGVELMFSAEVDRLYAATELNDWAVAVAVAGGDPGAAGDTLERIAALAASEQAERRGALELIAAAEARGLPWLIDDELLSIGYFDGCACWPVGALPQPEQVEWSRLRAGPLALITGTNGKTTTTRLLARMGSKQGLRVGNTSTDGLFVHEQLVEAGDWTGPGGARAVLRNPKVELALLEAARGGLLRRGAGVHGCRVAVITNVAQDHLGEYGVFDLEAMAAAKGVVASIVDPDGRVVLGADCPALVTWAQGRTLPAPIVWFSTDADNPMLREALAAGAEVWAVVDRKLCRMQGDERHELCGVETLPLSLGGLARHNLANALAAAAAARGLGLDDAAIVAGLQEFGARADDNPGRARIWKLAQGVELLLDFAHNLAGIAAIAEITRGLARPTQLCFGMAGDRSDAEMLALGSGLAALAPRRVVLHEQQHYLRGRERGETPRLLEQGLRASGYVGEILRADDEVGAIEVALEGAASGELIVVLAHAEREQVRAWLRSRGAES